MPSSCSISTRYAKLAMNVVNLKTVRLYNSRINYRDTYSAISAVSNRVSFVCVYLIISALAVDISEWLCSTEVFPYTNSQLIKRSPASLLLCRNEIR